MQVRLLRAKLHQACVTKTRLDYHGSVTIDEQIAKLAGLYEHEVVTVANMANGQRGETYVIFGAAGSREIQLNGAMARLAQPGDRVILFSYAYLEPAEVKKHRPTVLILNEKNEVTERID